MTQSCIEFRSMRRRASFGRTERGGLHYPPWTLDEKGKMAAPIRGGAASDIAGFAKGERGLTILFVVNLPCGTRRQCCRWSA